MVSGFTALGFRVSGLPHRALKLRLQRALCNQGKDPDQETCNKGEYSHNNDKLIISLARNLVPF